MEEDDLPSVTPEEIQRFKQIQKLKQMINLSQISRKREEELTVFALELMIAGTDKDQIGQIISVRESLSPVEQRALKTILLTF